MSQTRIIHRPGNKEALALWYTVVLQGVRSDAPDLSARQMAIMLTVYIDPKPYSVKALAARLKVSKPAISRALDTLEKLKMVKREEDRQDKRNVLIKRTNTGYDYLAGFSETILNNLAAIS